MKQNTIILVVVLMLVVGGGSFGIGYKIAERKSVVSSFARNGTGQMMGNRNIERSSRNAGTQGQQAGGMMRGNRQTIGDVISLDDKSITVKMPDGSSRIVLLSSTMTVTQLADAKVSDLKVGSKVAVFGTNNTDGSQTATSIELNPRMPNLTVTPQK